MLVPTTATLPPPANATLCVLLLDRDGKPYAIAPLTADRLAGTLDPEFARIEATPVISPALVPLSGGSEGALLRQIESALKSLYDPVFLGEHSLARSASIRARMAAHHMPDTLLSRATSTRALLLELVDQLRPAGTAPRRTQVPTRLWHYYLILHQAYVEDETNYQIMHWLQISEGTFNRTRRRALLAIARSVMEMELGAAARWALPGDSGGESSPACPKQKRRQAGNR